MTRTRSLKRLALVAVVLSLATVLPLTSAAEIVPSASSRFASATGEEVPSFQRHVLPLLGRLGCNGRACHGSFQGQAGFRLSLFGYDFAADHAALALGEKPRIRKEDPAASLLLKKPLREVPHKGGQRFEPGSWQHHLLARWIRAGAPAANEADPAFASLTLEPAEIVFGKAGQTAPLRVTARWADGVREDVTPLCRFRSNDESIATVDSSGVVTSVSAGDTHVVAFYDNGVAPVSVLLPVSDRIGARYPQIPTPTRIDELVGAKLKKLGIVPSELCTDAEFLRRASLDITGTLPDPAEVTAFLADRAADKRAKKIDELLARPGYAAWWTTRLCDVTGNSDRNGPQGGEQSLNKEKSKQWYQWIYRRVRDNVPYDDLVEDLVLSTSRQPGQSYDEYCTEMSSYFRKSEPADFSARETMPYFWTRRQLGQPGQKALGFAYSFLGVSLQCAECHKHPFDQWTKQDFDQFTAFFNGVRYTDASRARAAEMKKEVGLTGDEDSGAYKRKFVDLLATGKTLPFKELALPPRAKEPKRPNPKVAAGRVITPKLLGGEEVIASKYPDPRQPLMDWLRQDDNPYFARALVNRVWAGYFHTGLIDPTDDLNLANPASNEAVLDYLAAEFIRRNFDMKWLHREIAGSRTYQLSWRPNETNRLDERNFSRAVLRRLPAEVIYDALRTATLSAEAVAKMNADPVATRAIGFESGVSSRDGSDYAVNLFGASPRQINCDCERSREPSLLQSVFLRNDDEVLGLLDARDSWPRQVQKQKDHDPAALVREAYLRTLGRPPEERERSVAAKHLAASPDVASGLRDLLWALLNTKEFVLNH